MDAALGPPAKMAELDDELTPMMAQYFELCEQYDEALVLFQVGDFYEAFCAAAERVARLCEITLTQRSDSTGEYAMAGIPIDNAESYIETLLDAGYRVAIADQVEDPDEVSGVVERAVTRVVTPGTLTEAELLDGADSNYVAALAAGGELAPHSLHAREDPRAHPDRARSCSTGHPRESEEWKGMTMEQRYAFFAPIWRVMRDENMPVSAESRLVSESSRLSLLACR